MTKIEWAVIAAFITVAVPCGHDFIIACVRGLITLGEFL